MNRSIAAIAVMVVLAGCSPHPNGGNVRLAAEAATLAKLACGKDRPLYGPWRAVRVGNIWTVKVFSEGEPPFSVTIDAVTRKAGRCTTLYS